MIVKTLIFAVILVALGILALSVKLLINKKAEFPAHSCGLEDGELNEDGSCAACDLKNFADCPEIK